MLPGEDYHETTDEEWAEYESAMDAYMERAAAEYEASEREEYEKHRPFVEQVLARLGEQESLLPSPWLRVVGINRDGDPTDWYEATAGPFKIEITHDFVDDEDGGWPTWRWEASDTRVEGPFFGFASNGYYDDHTDIRAAARNAIECCRKDLDDAPEAEEALEALLLSSAAGSEPRADGAGEDESDES